MPSAFNLTPIFGGGSVSDVVSWPTFYDFPTWFPPDPGRYYPDTPDTGPSGLDPNAPPTKSYPPRKPPPLPGNYNPRPGVPEAPLAGPLRSGLVGGIVKGSLIYSLLMQISAEIFDLLPKADLSKDLLNKNIARQALLELENRLRRTGPTSRGGARRPRELNSGVSTDAKFAQPPRQVASVAPGNPGPSRSRGTSTSPMAVAAAAPGTGAHVTTAPVAPGTTLSSRTKPGRADPFARTKAILARARAPTVAPPLSPFVQAMQRFAQTELQALADRPGLRRGRSRLQDFAPERPEPETPFAESPLTGFQPYGVGYDTAVDQCGVKKRKPGKPRTVCYSGKYREKADGLTKSRGRKIPCLPSRSKSRS